LRFGVRHDIWTMDVIPDVEFDFDSSCATFDIFDIILPN
jgi:hypothetical protein